VCMEFCYGQKMPYVTQFPKGATTIGMRSLYDEFWMSYEDRLQSFYGRNVSFHERRWKARIIWLPVRPRTGHYGCGRSYEWSERGMASRRTTKEEKVQTDFSLVAPPASAALTHIKIRSSVTGYTVEVEISQKLTSQCDERVAILMVSVLEITETVYDVSSSGDVKTEETNLYPIPLNADFCECCKPRECGSIGTKDQCPGGVKVTPPKGLGKKGE